MTEFISIRGARENNLKGEMELLLHGKDRKFKAKFGERNITSPTPASSSASTAPLFAATSRRSANARRKR
jgi:hypothetical protein